MQISGSIPSPPRGINNRSPSQEFSKNWNTVPLHYIGKWDGGYDSANYQIAGGDEDGDASRLFTLLKQNKYNKDIQCKHFHHYFNGYNNKNCINLIHNFYYHKIGEKRKDVFSELGLSDKQKDQIQKLKFQKVQYILNEYARSGRDVRSIMEDDVIPMLYQQIGKIFYGKYNELRTAVDNDQIYSSTPEQNTVNKNLQSTAECNDKSSNKGNYYQYKYKQAITPANSLELKSINQVKRKKLTIDIDNFKNEDSNIKQPFYQKNQRMSKSNRDENCMSQFTLFQRKIESIINQEKQEIDNFMEFTLGGQNDQQDNQNFTERQHQMEKIELFNSLNNYQEVKEKDNHIISQLSQNYPSQRCIPLKSSKTYQMIQNTCKNQVLTFTRKHKRVPKGKAIKNKVMGDICI